MSQTYAPIQPYNLIKSCMIVLIVQVVIVILSTPVFLLDPTIRLLILPINLFISVFLGWHLYKRSYHMIFAYDNKGFTLKKGRKEEAGHRWKEFSKVSLLRTEEGSFSVRLYDNSEFFDLPVSKLKLNPFDFRFEVMSLVSGGKDRK